MLEKKPYPRQTKQSNAKGKSKHKNKNNSLDNAESYRKNSHIWQMSKSKLSIPDKKTILEIYLQSVVQRVCM